MTRREPSSAHARTLSMSRALALPSHFIARTWRSRFARNVAVVATGTAAAHAITLIFAPLITRLYGPEAFGVLGTFMALVAMVTPIAALSYPIAIVLPKDDGDAIGLARLSVYLSVTMAMLVSIALWVGGDWLVNLLGVASISAFILLIPLVMLFSAWVQIAHQWLIRKGEFGVVAKVAVAQSLVVNGAKSSIGWFHPVAPVLIVLATLGQAFHAALLLLGAYRRIRENPVVLRGATPTPLRTLAHRHRDFALYRSPQVFINAVSQGVPVLLLAGLFGPVAAGFYTLGAMALGLPSALFGKAVSDVFYPKVTEAAHAGKNLSQLIMRSTAVLFAAGLFPFGVVFVFGPDLFGFVFGPEWDPAGEYARWLALFFLFHFINKPSVAAVPVLGIQPGLLIYEGLSTGSKILGMLLGFFCFTSDIWAVALFSIIGVIAYSAMMLWIVWHAQQWSRNAKTG